jgi:general secretion pathway protein D
MVAPIRISDGQTAVLAGGEDKLDLVRSKAAGPPLLSDLPVIGRLFREEHAKMQKTRLVVLVTARIVDPAGNPIRSGEEISAETPSQPDRRLN